MKTTQGYNATASGDNTGFFLSVDWTCPYCDFTNYDFVFSSNKVDVFSGVAMERTCDWCNKTVTIECPNIEPGLLD